ncbi:transcriptional regulator [Mycobacterium sp. Soil538]|nr:transcriptional regulator [Mycobacterium sp. Soil538]
MQRPPRSPRHRSIRAVAALSDDMRWRLYDFARAQRRPVSRDEAASAAGISRRLAAFHLDKLVEAGLLQFHFRQPMDARAGRPPKVYALADTELDVSIPTRRHGLLADILAHAVLAENEHGSARVAAACVAHERGVTSAAAASEPVRGGRLSAERTMRLVEEALADHGFEPYPVPQQCVRLRNCPFHPLARQLPELVCELNLSFVRGVLDGLQSETLEAVLAPAGGECCVELRPVALT